jgi:hypothetical protein
MHRHLALRILLEVGVLQDELEQALAWDLVQYNTVALVHEPPPAIAVSAAGAVRAH